MNKKENILDKTIYIGVEIVGHRTCVSH